MNEPVKISAEIKADMSPIVESTPKGVKALYRLFLGKMEAKNNYTIELINAQKKKDKDLIKNGFAKYDSESKKLIILEKKSIDEANNISNCLDVAHKELKNDKREPKGEISLDFVNKWRFEASLISSEEAALIWGKILAEEIISPSTISLRSLDTLKNLSKDEILLFSELCNYIVFDCSLLRHESHEHKLYQLADAGLLVFAGMGLSDKWEETTLNINKNNETSVTKGFFLQKDDLLIFIEQGSLQNKPDVSFLSLTKAGREIYQIAKKDAELNLDKLSDVIFSQINEINKITYYKYIDKEKLIVDLLNPIAIIKKD